MCFSCLVTGVMSSTVGGLSALGINLPQEISPPATVKGRVVSTLSPPILVGITLFALKHFFNISLCSGGGFTLRNVIQVGIKTLPMGLIYSLSINYLLNRYVCSLHSNGSSSTSCCHCPSQPEK